MATKKKRTLAQCADRLYQAREERYALNRQVKALEEEETELRERIIQELPKSQASGISGHIANAVIKMKTVPLVDDWPAVFTYCAQEYMKHKRKGDGMEMESFSILQRRLSSEAVNERWEAGVALPGVSSMDVKTVSINKL